jgi:hypothetical protein
MLAASFEKESRASVSKCKAPSVFAVAAKLDRLRSHPLSRPRLTSTPMNALKRLSWNSTGDQQQPHLVPPSGRSPQPGTHTPLSYAISPRSAPSSPSYPFPIVPAPPVFKPQVERPTLHKSLAALSGLLVALDEYRDLSAASAKAQKKVAKACKEVAATFGDKVEPGARSEVICEL